jgi:hypothetical protein
MMMQERMKSGASERGGKRERERAKKGQAPVINLATSSLKFSIKDAAYHQEMQNYEHGSRRFFWRIKATQV